jgi:hypothetical protein
MTYVDDHHRRWGALFAKEPWWDVQCALYEGPGHDWEDADLAMEQMLYALAKARGLDTQQVCLKCHRTVDQVRSLPLPGTGSYRACEACRAQDEWERNTDELIMCEKYRAHVRWYESLPPDERKAYDQESDAAVRIYLDGILTRDVS